MISSPAIWDWLTYFGIFDLRQERCYEIFYVDALLCLCVYPLVFMLLTRNMFISFWNMLISFFLKFRTAKEIIKKEKEIELDFPEKLLFAQKWTERANDYGCSFGAKLIFLFFTKCFFIIWRKKCFYLEKMFYHEKNILLKKTFFT